MHDGLMYKQDPVSVDFARYRHLDREWRRVPPPGSRASVAPADSGRLHVDRQGLVLERRRTARAAASPIRASASAGCPIPEGYVSVDGALFDPEADVEAADAEGA
jgi:hypothetical protein